MILFFLAICMFISSSDSVCSELQDDLKIYLQNINQKYVHLSLIHSECMMDRLPLATQKTLWFLNSKIALQAFYVWKEVGGCKLGEHYEEIIATTLYRLRKRLEILWNVKYKEKLGEDALHEYYQLIKDADYNFSHECFINEKICAINEKVLFSYMDDVIEQSVNTKIHESSEPELQETQSTTKRTQTSAAAALRSATDLPIWAKQEWVKIIKLKKEQLVFEHMFNKFVRDIDILVDENMVPHVHATPANMLEVKKNFLLYAYNTALLVLTISWKSTYKKKMGKHNIDIFYELIQHCWDDYPDHIFDIVIDREVNQTKARIIFVDKVTIFIENQIGQAVQNYLQEQEKKSQEERQAHELLEQTKKNEILRLDELRKQKQQCSNRFDRCKQSLEELFTHYTKDIFKTFYDSCQLILTQEYDDLCKVCQDKKNHEFQNSCKMVQDQQQTRQLKRMQDAAQQQLLLAANAQSAQRFYDAQQTSEMRKMKEQKRLYSKQYKEKIRELFSLSDCARAAIETEEELKIKNIDTLMKREWKIAMLATIKRSNDTIKFLKHKEHHLAENNANLAKRLHTIEMQRLSEMEHNNQVIQQLQRLLATRSTVHSNHEANPPVINSSISTQPLLPPYTDSTSPSNSGSISLTELLCNPLLRLTETP
ncbi:MAG TPA: hypothetical protein VLG50_04285 [Candidatus Saccharimonadales bacterium]|nr:hypothetical protein [Candidatus Saccharimonadales bacterium]